MDERDGDLIPEHLREGWEAYRDWWMSRYRAGNPLPQGGTFILSKQAVLLDEIFRFHCEAADGLGVPFEAINVDLEQDRTGRVVPKVDFQPPASWAAPVAKPTTTHAPEELDRVQGEYVAGYLKVLYEAMRERLNKRILGLSRLRKAAAPRKSSTDG